MLYDSNSQLVIESFFELLKSLVLNDTFSDEYLQMKEKGLVRSEGKDYVMQEDDVVLFRFNV